jgi:hypothetical protein
MQIRQEARKKERIDFIGAYMLMHIVTAVICIVGLTTFTRTTDAR